jgi:hypothetical protein
MISCNCHTLLVPSNICSRLGHNGCSGGRIGRPGTSTPAALSEDEAIASLEALVKTENAVAAMKAAVALRLADFDIWRTEGDRSPAHLLARKAGMGVGAARDALSTAERAKALPGVESALRKGELSPGQANAITDAATADPGSEERLLDCAKRTSLSELRDECARTKAAADPDPEETHRRIHAQRRARMRDCPDGAGEITYRSTKDEIAEFWKMVQHFGDKAFRAARSEGRVEGHDAYLADGMLGMARAAAGGTSKKRVPTKVIVRIDWDALVRGYPIEGETCEVSGIGPVPVGIVRNMIERGDVFLASVVTKGQDVVNVVHYSRKPARCSTRHWSGSTRPAPSRAAITPTGWRSTTERTGPTPRSPC